MALSKVGASAVVSGSLKSVNDTFTVTFTPDSAWSTNDLLFCMIGLGAVTAASSISADKSSFSVSAGWHEFPTVGYDYYAPGYSSHMNFFPAYHFVTAGEAGAGTITLTVTIDDLSTLNGNGIYVVPAGVAVRGADTINALYASPDSNDVDLGAISAGSSSGHAATWNAATGYTGTSTAGTLVYYLASTGGKTSVTADSGAWTGPTELSDTFLQDWVETGASDLDTWVSAAYELLAAGDDNLPADSVTETFTGTTHTFRAARMLLVLDATPLVYETAPPPYQLTSRRVNIRELPHEVTSPMFDDL